MKIGDKRLVVNIAPYHHFTGHNDTPVKFVELEVVEECVGKGEHTGDEGEGFLAKGSDGYMYGYNYPHVNEGHGSTVWMRHMPDDEFLALSEQEKSALVEDLMWPDMTMFQCPAEAVVARDKDYIEYCETHQHHFYTAKGCSHCKFNLKTPEVKMNMEEYAWIGWYDEVQAKSA